VLIFFWGGIGVSANSVRQEIDLARAQVKHQHLQLKSKAESLFAQVAAFEKQSLGRKINILDKINVRRPGNIDGAVAVIYTDRGYGCWLTIADGSPKYIDLDVRSKNKIEKAHISKEKATKIAKKFAAKVFDLSAQWTNYADTIKTSHNDYNLNPIKCWKITMYQHTPEGHPYWKNFFQITMTESGDILNALKKQKIPPIGKIKFSPVPEEKAFRSAIAEAEKSIRISPILKRLSSGSIDRENHGGGRLVVVRPNNFRNHKNLSVSAKATRNSTAHPRLAWEFYFNWLHPDETKRRPWEYSVLIFVDAETLDYQEMRGYK